MKLEFINFVEKLMEASPDLTKELMTDEIKAYMNILRSTSEVEKPVITDSGKVILKYMQTCDKVALKSNEIAEGLFVSTRKISGAMRKLVSDGFVEKVSTDPIIYSITEKGKNYIID